MSHLLPTLSHGQRTHWRINPPSHTHTQVHVQTHAHRGIQKASMCLKQQQETETTASSRYLQQHLLMFLCLRLLIIVPLVSKGIAAPYSQSIDLKMTDSLQCKSNFIEVLYIYTVYIQYIYIYKTLSLVLWPPLSLAVFDIMPVENNKKRS